MLGLWPSSENGPQISSINSEFEELFLAFFSLLFVNIFSAFNQKSKKRQYCTTINGKKVNRTWLLLWLWKCALCFISRQPKPYLVTCFVLSRPPRSNWYYSSSPDISNINGSTNFFCCVKKSLEERIRIYCSYCADNDASTSNEVPQCFYVSKSKLKHHSPRDDR